MSPIWARLGRDPVPGGHQCAILGTGSQKGALSTCNDIFTSASCVRVRQGMAFHPDKDLCRQITLVIGRMYHELYDGSVYCQKHHFKALNIVC